jgi:hypothetical protein
MRTSEFKSFCSTLVKLPSLEAVHADSLAKLQAAFAAAGFTFKRSISCALVAPGAPAAYWGGFEVVDPALSSTLRVMASLGHSATRYEKGLALNWVVTPAHPVHPGTPRAEATLLSQHMRPYRMSEEVLNHFDEAQVTAWFVEALTAPDAFVSAQEATDFVSDLVEALAP